MSIHITVRLSDYAASSARVAATAQGVTLGSYLEAAVIAALAAGITASPSGGRAAEDQPTTSRTIRHTSRTSGAGSAVEGQRKTRLRQLPRLRMIVPIPVAELRHRWDVRK